MLVRLLKFLLLFYLFDVVSSGPISCPSNYTALNDKKCIMIIDKPLSYQNAIQECSYNNGQLVSIQNAIDNNGVTMYASHIQPGNSDPIWLGLTCNQTDLYWSCRWADGSGNATYTNFAPGNPSSLGDCVLLMTSGSSKGKWYSAGCQWDYGFVCETDPLPPIDSDCVNKLGDYCYFPMDTPSTLETAMSICQQECSNLASIHSFEENSYIKSFFKNVLVSDYILLGAFLDKPWDTFSWNDPTPWNYDNFGYKNNNFGSCLGMATKNDFVEEGKWINVNCDSSLPFVCERASNVSCSTTPTSTVPPTTPSIPQYQCFGTQVLDDNVTISSPYYPSSYIGAGRCMFGFDTSPGSVTQIQFPVLNLDPKASISLYNKIEDAYPFVVLTYQNNGSSQWYNSTSNTMKLVFQPCEINCSQNTKVYKWAGYFRKSYDVFPTYSTPRTNNFTTPSNNIFTTRSPFGYTTPRNYRSHNLDVNTRN